MPFFPILSALPPYATETTRIFAHAFSFGIRRRYRNRYRSFLFPNSFSPVTRHLFLVTILLPTDSLSIPTSDPGCVYGKPLFRCCSSPLWYFQNGVVCVAVDWSAGKARGGGCCRIDNVMGDRICFDEFIQGLKPFSELC